MGKLILAYLFLIFTGLLGGHRIYLGRYVSALVYALTGGLFGLGLIWDFFIGIPLMVCCDRKG